MSDPKLFTSTRMRFHLALACCGLLLQLSLAARAQAVPAESQAVQVGTLDGLPAEVRSLMRDRFGEVGDAGIPLSAGCLIAPGEWRQRFQGAEVSADRIRVRVVRGGRAYSSFAVDYVPGPGGWEEDRETMPPQVARMQPPPRQLRLPVALGPGPLDRHIPSEDLLR